MELLTDDVLAEVLRRLPRRSLAVSRCVSRAWRALIDGDGILRAALLPRCLAGLLIYDDHNYNPHHQEQPQAMLFARPGAGGVGSASDDYSISIPRGFLRDHCNGLLLFYGGVHNPAMGRRATVPERARTDRVLEYEFLAFDPAVSPSHYEVVMVPYAVPCVLAGGAMLASEWPPSPWILSVFSSATGLWEEKPFIRQGEPAGILADLGLNWTYWREDGRAEYWRGALYVHCKSNFVTRISLSDSTYRVIKPPRCFGNQEFVIGRSEKGIYSAFLDDKYRFWIWTLDESSDDQIEWKLRHFTCRGIAFPSPGSGRGPWILYDNGSRDQDGDEFKWNSDDDNDDNDGNTILRTDDTVDEQRKFIRVMAFHPCKEIVFFDISSRRVMAYHLSSSKLEDLGKLPANDFHALEKPCIY